MTDTADQTPDFASMTPNPMGAMFLSTLWNSHVAYCDNFDAVYPDIAPTGRYNSWRDSLPTVSTINGEVTLAEANDIARLSEDPAEVVTVWRCAIMLAANATENLTGLHSRAKRRPTVEQSDAATVEALRLQLNSEIKIARGMADAGFFTHETLDALLPFRVTPKGRKNYDGPALPNAKRPSPLRANTKKLTITVDGKPAGDDAADFSTNVKSVLHLTMSELKSLVGEFTDENYGQDFTAPNGVKFQVIMKSNADEIVEDDTEEDDDE